MITLNTKSRTLIVYGHETRINGGAADKAFNLLKHLVEHSGRLRSKDDILSAVWREELTNKVIIVTPRNVDQAVHKIRKTLGKTVITTLPGLGIKLTRPERFQID